MFTDIGPTAIYPDKAIRKGSTWKSLHTTNDGKNQFTYENRLIGLETRSNRPAYKILSKIQGTGSAPTRAGQSVTSQTTGAATSYVDKQTGWMLSASGTMDMQMSMGGMSQNMQMTFQIEGKPASKPAAPSKTKTKKS
jgi:hypothetical protein